MKVSLVIFRLLVLVFFVYYATSFYKNHQLAKEVDQVAQHCYRGLELYEEGKFLQVIDELRKVKMSSDSDLIPTVPFFMSIAYLQLGKKQEAENCLNISIDLYDTGKFEFNRRIYSQMHLRKAFYQFLRDDFKGSLKNSKIALEYSDDDEDVRQEAKKMINKIEIILGPII